MGVPKASPKPQRILNPETPSYSKTRPQKPSNWNLGLVIQFQCSSLGCLGFIGFIGLIGFIVFIGLIGLIGLIGYIGLIGFLGVLQPGSPGVLELLIDLCFVLDIILTFRTSYSGSAELLGGGFRGYRGFRV